jgi:hypothetical protein
MCTVVRSTELRRTTRVPVPQKLEHGPVRQQNRSTLLICAVAELLRHVAKSLSHCALTKVNNFRSGIKFCETIQLPTSKHNLTHYCEGGLNCQDGWSEVAPLRIDTRQLVAFVEQRHVEILRGSRLKNYGPRWVAFQLLTAKFMWTRCR